MRDVDAQRPRRDVQKDAKLPKEESDMENTKRNSAKKSDVKLLNGKNVVLNAKLKAKTDAARNTSNVAKRSPPDKNSC